MGATIYCHTAIYAGMNCWTLPWRADGRLRMNKEYLSRMDKAVQIHDEKAKKDPAFDFDAISLVSFIAMDSDVPHVHEYQFNVTCSRTFSGAPCSSFDEHKKKKESLVDRLSYEDEKIADESDVLESRINKGRFNEYNFLVNAAGRLKDTDIDSVGEDMEEFMLSANELADKWGCLFTLNKYLGGVASQKKAHFQVINKTGSFLDNLCLDKFGNVNYEYLRTGSVDRIDCWLNDLCSGDTKLYTINDFFRLPDEEYGKANLVIMGGSRKDRVSTACKIQRELGARQPLIMSGNAILLVPNRNEAAVMATPTLKLRPGAVEYTGISIPVPGVAVHPNGLCLPLAATGYKNGTTQISVFDKDHTIYQLVERWPMNIMFPGYRISNKLAETLVKEARHFMYNKHDLFFRNTNDCTDMDKRRDREALEPY